SASFSHRGARERERNRYCCSCAAVHTQTHRQPSFLAARQLCRPRTSARTNADGMQLQPPPFPTSPQSPNDGRVGGRDPNPFLYQGNSSSSTSRPSPSHQQQFDEPPLRRSSPPPPSAPRQQQQQQVLPPRQSPPSATVPRGRYSAPLLAEQQ
ncbi:unnamed protein product, partial [Ectocarpus sp. 13 AM-2016]